MAILSEHVDAYLRELRPHRGEVMAAMEAVADRDGVPIVSWETGRLLATLCRALDPRVLEVGTAIGYSTLHMAEALVDGSVITLERDADRAAQAADFLRRAGVADRVEIVEGEGHWGEESLSAARELNAELLTSERWLGSVLPVGDGIGVAARRRP